MVHFVVLILTLEDVNIGVSQTQCFDPEENNDEYESSGITCPGNASLTSVAEDAMLRSLKEAAMGNSSVPALDWPQQSSQPVSEFDTSIRIFVNAFPHLFPGGI